MYLKRSTADELPCSTLKKTSLIHAISISDSHRKDSVAHIQFNDYDVVDRRHSGNNEGSAETNSNSDRVRSFSRRLSLKPLSNVYKYDFKY